MGKLNHPQIKLRFLNEIEINPINQGNQIVALSAILGFIFSILILFIDFTFFKGRISKLPE